MLTVAQKQDIAARFVGGQTVTDIATFHGVKRETVEQVVREGFLILMKQSEAFREQVGQN